ncbi:hypothetical protein B0H11DRAFT_709413 [Mycena galericulata]|nr:hypothetical protein B0H11DRAFT_709413 [Mycena galericulata]
MPSPSPDAVPPTRATTTPLAARPTCYASAATGTSPHPPAISFPTLDYAHALHATPARTHCRPLAHRRRRHPSSPMSSPSPPRTPRPSALVRRGGRAAGAPGGMGCRDLAMGVRLLQDEGNRRPVCRKTEDTRRNECDMASDSREVVQVQVQLSLSQRIPLHWHCPDPRRTSPADPSTSTFLPSLPSASNSNVQRSTPVLVRPNPRSNSEGRLRGVQRSERPPSFERCNFD